MDLPAVAPDGISAGSRIFFFGPGFDFFSSSGFGLSDAGPESDAGFFVAADAFLGAAAALV
ncbi:MAG: hypothetical protein IPQ13_02140 [Holophagaceae bacterium]|nr:hypothetical protein [Holophagaceae bacterium]